MEELELNLSFSPTISVSKFTQMLEKTKILAWVFLHRVVKMLQFEIPGLISRVSCLEKQLEMGMKTEERKLMH